MKYKKIVIVTSVTRFGHLAEFNDFIVHLAFFGLCCRSDWHDENIFPLNINSRLYMNENFI